MRSTTVPLSEPAFRRRVEEALRQAGGPVTLGDVVASTGLPAEQTENLLLDLLDEYRGHLAVDERGNLIYRFPYGLQRPSTWRERLRQGMQRALEVAYRFFKAAFKVWIMLMLIVYFILFLALTLLLIAMVLSGGSRGSRSRSGAWGGRDDFDLSDLLFWWWWMEGGSRRRRWGWGWDWGGPAHTPEWRRSRSWQRTPRPAASTRSRPLWERIYAFVFGEERPKPDPLAREKEALAYLRERAGRLTTADLIALFGMSLQEAEEFATRLMVAYNGDVEVSENGSLIYTFDSIMPSLLQGRVEARRRRYPWLEVPQGFGWRYWWEKREKPEPFDENPQGTDSWLIFFNLFNLAWSSAFAFGSAFAWLGWEGGTLLSFLLGWFPFTFSVLFFLIPSLRWMALQRENRARQERNEHRRVVKEVYQQAILPSQPTPLYPEAFAASLGGDIFRAKAWLERLRREWEGDLESDEEGVIFYLFPRLWQEWQDVRRARRQVRAEEHRLGRIEYSSEE